MIMKDKILKNNGIALITVILIIVILVAVVIELNRSSRADIYDAANLSDGIKLTYIAKSGFYGAAALLILTNSKKEYDTLYELANMETISLQSNTLFPEGYFITRIEDENGKIPLNNIINNPAIKDMLVNLLEQPEFGLEPRKQLEIVDSIIDWIDADEEVPGFGAESSYYASLDPPYSAKNDQLDCIEELLMVKGITKEIFYGTKDKPGLAQYVTADSDGKININTAPKMVLRSLAGGITAELADRMDECRSKDDSKLDTTQWFLNMLSAAGVTNNPGPITVNSSYFKIISTGKMNNMSRTITGFVQRKDQNSVKIIKWRQD
jgi:general secretion pathway protein K